MAQHKRYPVQVPGYGWKDNMTLAGYSGEAPEAMEHDDFDDAAE